MQVVNEFLPLPRMAAFCPEAFPTSKIDEAMLPAFGILPGQSRTVEISIILPLVC